MSDVELGEEGAAVDLLLLQLFMQGHHLVVQCTDLMRFAVHHHR